MQNLFIYENPIAAPASVQCIRPQDKQRQRLIDTVTRCRIRSLIRWFGGKCSENKAPIWRTSANSLQQDAGTCMAKSPKRTVRAPAPDWHVSMTLFPGKFGESIKGNLQNWLQTKKWRMRTELCLDSPKIKYKNKKELLEALCKWMNMQDNLKQST
jgi:hypothetical protein